jgi:hypothetical protein
MELVLLPARQDYIANPSTMEMAYNVLIDHALAGVIVGLSFISFLCTPKTRALLGRSKTNLYDLIPSS